MNLELQKLGMRIKTARKELGLTGEGLAELCNLHPTYIRQLETGRKKPSLDTFLLLCDVLHVTPNFLLADSIDIPKTAFLYEDLSPSQQTLLDAFVQTLVGMRENEAGEDGVKTG